jgi:hypothetical protein
MSAAERNIACFFVNNIQNLKFLKTKLSAFDKENRKSRSEEWYSCFVLGKCQVHISSGKPGNKVIQNLSATFGL